ncbi:hypothetical protein H0N95_02695, partial [Candidatus Micrarchaeota archaeon]|nr:hypothetical protein [Candidatus Micrarchaeota archaeon]
MRKIIIILMMLATVGFCVKSIGLYDNEFTVVTKNSVIKIPVLLSNPITIDNKYRLSLVPQISFNNDVVTVASTVNEQMLSGEKSRFTLGTETERGDMKVTEEIEIEEELIRTTTTVQNIGKSTATASLLFNVNAEQSTFFFPAAVSKNSNNYLVVMSQSLEGRAIGIKANAPMDTGTEQKPLRNASTYVIGTRTPSLKPGQSITVSLVIYPF